MSNGRESDLIDAMLSIIRNINADAETARSAAVVIHVHANFTMRVTDLKKSRTVGGRFFQFLDFDEQVNGEALEIASAVKKGVGNTETSARLLTLRDKIASYDI